ncbi:MAG: alanine--tRNA ligase [Salibacteraceae bacterium]
MSLTTREIRIRFLEFFKDKSHEIVPSAPIVIKDDPTLMFTNAGMNQFKSIFIGNEDSLNKRVADTQKCLRVSGKHNDLEEVGKDHYHHTMFEMLGNWSFGDYFKKEAIAFSWELLTEGFGLDKDRIYVSIFEGDSEQDLEIDKEAKEIWQKHIGEDRILTFGRKENFWEMGETGPCGPCSEIHYDMRSDAERQKTDGKKLVNMDDPEVIEVWNLVFMQFNRLEDGSLVALKNKHIDTGMGLERLARAVQGVSSNYEIDLFQNIIRKVESVANKKYEGSSSESDIAFRVVADHIRAIGFCIADGQLPSNTGAGYVIRRILRRAIRYGFSQLSINKPFLHEVYDALNNEMGADFPELDRQADLVKRVILEEETSFLSTLEKGLERLNGLFASSAGKVVPGETAFELYDTYGFPIDLTQLIAQENGWSVDMRGFEKSLNAQKERSRNAGKTNFGDWTELTDEVNSHFLGYDQLSVKTTIAKYRVATLKGKEVAQIVLLKTPFYAESGGQVGDKGVLKSGDQIIKVFDTKKENNEIIHYASELPHDPSLGLEAEVNDKHRSDVKKNHSATHLLHHALRKSLGDHVEQKGSLVASDKLRFDFSHFERISDQMLQEIEIIVSNAIASGIELQEFRSMPIEKAKSMGAMALFGEKYGDSVRVIQFEGSIELCGGTHVENTSAIGGFKIMSESSVASGVRRIEAITGSTYQDYLNESLNIIAEIELELGNPKSILSAIKKLQIDLKQAQKKIEDFNEKEKATILDSLKNEIVDNGKIRSVVKRIDKVGGKTVKDTVYTLVLAEQNLMAIVLGDDEEKPFIVVGLSKQLAEELKLDASKIVRDLAQHIEGSGGGQKFLAMAGGKNKQGLRRALEHADEIIRIQAS